MQLPAKQLLSWSSWTWRQPLSAFPGTSTPLCAVLCAWRWMTETWCVSRLTGWPVGYECIHVRQALEEDVQLPVRVMDVQPIWHKQHPNLRFQGEFMVTAFMPSRHPTTEWVLRDAAGSLLARAPVKVSSLPVEREGQWARRVVPASLSSPAAARGSRSSGSNSPARAPHPHRGWCRHYRSGWPPIFPASSCRRSELFGSAAYLCSSLGSSH
jgi:hypothetical protein